MPSIVEAHRSRSAPRACRLALIAALFVFSIAAPLGAQDPNYVLHVTNAAGASGASAIVEVQLDISGAAIQGWSFGICHDSSKVTLAEAWDGETTLTVKNGSPPDFNVLTYYPNGFIKAVLVCFTSCATLPAGVNYTLNAAEYQIIAAAPDSAEISPCSTLGTPVVPVKVVVAGASIAMTRVGGTITVSAGDEAFVRGDANGDGSVNIADALMVLAHLFGSGALLCDDAADANDSGLVDLSDSVALLNYLFVSGSVMPSPSPSCGIDTTGADHCVWYPSCP